MKCLTAYQPVACGTGYQPVARGTGYEPVRSPADSRCHINVTGTRARGFTLLEWVVAIVIISIMLAVGAFGFRRMQEQSVLAQSRNAVAIYANIARNYAVANHIETMLVVNPYNGRFELWRLDPPRQGGRWDPLSSGDASMPILADGYAFVPLLDASAVLPRDGNGTPLAEVHPIDYDDPAYRPVSGGTEAELDNLTWAAFCFDENGKLVIRTRRIATRSYRFRNGLLRPAAQRNRLEDETPDLRLLASAVMVDVNDTPITSTRGFVITHRNVREDVVGAAPNASGLVNQWLTETQPGAKFAQFADTVVLDRFSGQVQAGDQ